MDKKEVAKKIDKGIWKKKRDMTCVDKTMNHEKDKYGHCKKCGKVFAVYYK